MSYLSLANKKPVTKHQAGGPVGAPAGGEGQPAQPAQPQAGDIDQMLQEAYQNQDPNMALQIVNIIMESQGQGGPAPEGGVPAGNIGMGYNRMPERRTMFRRNGGGIDLIK